MEQHKKKRIRKAIHGIIKMTYTIGNFYRILVNADFREFKNMEYATVERESVSDLQRLRYIKRLDMAKNGHIDEDLKSRMAFQREKSRLLDKEIQVRSVGYIEFVEKDSLQATVSLGYDQKHKRFKIAYSSYENIPKWKPLNRKEMVAHIARLHPTASNTLELRHGFTENSSEAFQHEDLKRIHTMYNQFVRESFNANKYIKQSILKPSEALLSDSLKYIGRQFFLPLEHDKPSVLTLTDVNSDYLVFQSYLKTMPKAKTHYFTIQEFKDLFIDNQIDLIAKLKHGLNLGTKNGILYIAQTSDAGTQKGHQWKKLDEILVCDSVSAKAKYYLSKTVITNKDFCIEKDAIVLQSGLHRAYMKRHFRTGRWNFSEEKAGEDKNFRPVTPEVLFYVQNKYGRAKNYAQVLKAFHRPTIKTTSKTQSHGQNV